MLSSLELIISASQVQHPTRNVQSSQRWPRQEVQELFSSDSSRYTQPMRCPSPSTWVTEGKSTQDFSERQDFLLSSCTASCVARRGRCCREGGAGTPAQGCGAPSQGRTMWAEINPQMDQVLRDHEEIHMNIVQNCFPKPYHKQAETVACIYTASRLSHGHIRLEQNPI